MLLDIQKRLTKKGDKEDQNPSCLCNVKTPQNKTKPNLSASQTIQLKNTEKTVIVLPLKRVRQRDSQLSPCKFILWLYSENHGMGFHTDYLPIIST